MTQNDSMMRPAPESVASPKSARATALSAHLADELIHRRRRWERRLFGFAVFTMTMHLLRIGPINLTLSDAALIIMLVILVLGRRLNFVPFGNLSFIWCLGLSLMLGGLLVASIVHEVPLRWLNVASQYIFAWLLLPMIFVSLDKEQLQRCMPLFVYGVAASEILAIGLSFLFPYTTLAGIFGPSFILGNGRVGALAAEANWNGAVIAFAFPMLIYCRGRGLISPFRTTVCVIALTWGLVACASFTGFGAAALAIAITVGVSRPGRVLAFGTPVVTGIMAYVAAGLPLPGIFQQRVAGALESGNIDQAGTFVDRAALIKEAWNMSGHNIVLGLGVDQYRVVSAFNAPVHQFLLLILNEGGAVALLGLLIMIGVLWARALQTFRWDRDAGAMAIAVLCVFCIFTSAVPHMYTRLWIGPVLLALAVARPQFAVGGIAAAMARMAPSKATGRSRRHNSAMPSAVPALAQRGAQ